MLLLWERVCTFCCSLYQQTLDEVPLYLWATEVTVSTWVLSLAEPRWTNMATAGSVSDWTRSHCTLKPDVIRFHLFIYLFKFWLLWKGYKCQSKCRESPFRSVQHSFALWCFQSSSASVQLPCHMSVTSCEQQRKADREAHTSSYAKPSPRFLPRHLCMCAFPPLMLTREVRSAPAFKNVMSIDFSGGIKCCVVNGTF